MLGIFSFLARAALILLVIWGIVKLVKLLKPRARHFTTVLQYPDREQIAMVEEGDMLVLDAEPQRHKIYAYRATESGQEGYLGEVPEKYFRSIEPILRSGDNYQAVVTRRTPNNVYVEFHLGRKALPDEFV